MCEGEWRMEKLKLLLKLIAISIGLIGIGWFIGSIIALKMSCGG